MMISQSCLMISYTLCPKLPYSTCMKTKGYCFSLYEIKVQVYKIIKIDGTAFCVERVITQLKKSHNCSISFR